MAVDMLWTLLSRLDTWYFKVAKRSHLNSCTPECFYQKEKNACDMTAAEGVVAE